MVNVSEEIKKYLVWRCRMNWPGKYTKVGTTYIEEWISNVTQTQLDYIVNHEMPYMIKNNFYKI